MPKHIAEYKAVTSEINSGTEDGKFVTPAQLCASKIVKGAASCSNAIVDFKRSNNTVYDLICQYTGEYFSANKATAKPTGATITDADVDNILYFKLGSEYFKRTILNGIIDVSIFGAVGDGVTDDTLAIKKASLLLTNGMSLRFTENSTYLISYKGAPYSSVFGYAVIDLVGLKNISIIGSGSKIKAVNHNITTNGGFRFMNLASCQVINISDFVFDMTFTGVNTSSSFYPFCGAIVGTDASTGTGSYDTLNSDITVTGCTFKLFHPFGAYTYGTNPYAGDPNNGYKLYSVYFSGDYMGQTFATQNRNIRVQDCKFLDGHNGYAVWVWAFSNIEFISIKAESYVSKKSNVSGGGIGDGLPFLRYHQFYCSGLKIQNCEYRAKPSNERLVAGFEGSAGFTNLDTNLSGDHSNGSITISGNRIIAGRGDAANSLPDIGIYIFCYGDITISDNFFDETPGSVVNAYGGSNIFYNAEVVGGMGSGTLKIINNTFGQNNSYSNNIVIANGVNSSAADRRLKSLEISSNFSYGQAQYFLQILSNTKTYYGVSNLTINNAVVDGTSNLIYGPASTNSRAFSVSASEATDVIKINHITVRNKYYGVMNDLVNSSATFQTTSPVFYGVTSPYLGTSPVTPYLQKNTVTSRIPKNDGSNNLANSGLVDNGTNVTADQDIFALGNLKTGKAGTGTGGRILIKSDDGVDRWQVGHLGSGGAKNFNIVDLVHSTIPLLIDNATGDATFAGKVTASVPTASTHLATKGYVDGRQAASNSDVASTNATDLATAITLVNELKTVVNGLQAKMRTGTLLA